MHKGNPYPFVKEFWCPNWMFWPNYAWRKIFLNGFSTLPGDDWAQVVSLMPLKSDEAVVDDLNFTVTYDFAVPGPGALLTLVLGTFFPQQIQRGKMILSYLNPTGQLGRCTTTHWPYSPSFYPFVGPINGWTANHVAGHFSGAVPTIDISPVSWANL